MHTFTIDYILLKKKKCAWKVIEKSKLIGNLNNMMKPMILVALIAIVVRV